MTSFHLKIIALIAMTIDHTANIIGQTNLFPNMPLEMSFVLIHLMKGVGRIAFPLYAFLIAEGAQKTSSMPKYIGRLGLFAFLSEPIFYFSNWRTNPSISGLVQNVVTLRWGNVFFTLALGAIAIAVYQILEHKQAKYKPVLFALSCLVITLFGAYLCCDYGAAGILLIIFLFLARTKAQKSMVILLWTVCLYGVGQSNNPVFSIVIDCFFAALSCVFVWLYNGKRGKRLKWAFYIYYPAHLLVLTVIHGLAF